MTYGPDKARDIANGSLASSRRKGARDNQALIHRAHRHAVRQALRQHRDALSEVDYWDAAPSDDSAYRKIAEADFHRNENLKENMWDRRNDNLGAAFRWGEKATEGVADEDVRTTVFRLMPDTVAGRHCANHVADWLEVERGYYNNSWYYPTWRADLAERRWIDACKAAFYVEILNEILNDGLRQQFNARWNMPYKMFDGHDFVTRPGSKLTTKGKVEEFLRLNLREHSVRLVNVLKEMGYSVPA